MVAHWFIPVLYFIAGLWFALKMTTFFKAAHFVHYGGRMISLMYRTRYQQHAAPVFYISSHKGTRAGHRVVRGNSSSGWASLFEDKIICNY
jgi:hypothetical protein